MFPALYFVLQLTPNVGMPTTAIGVYSDQEKCELQGEAIIDAYAPQRAKARCDPAQFNLAPIAANRRGGMRPRDPAPLQAARAQ